MTTELDLEEIRTRYNDTTPGTWWVNSDHEIRSVQDQAVSAAFIADIDPVTLDGYFIVQAHNNDIPALIAEVERLRAEQARPPLSDQITAAIGTDDWLVVCSSRPLGHELITAEELDEYSTPEPAVPITCRVCGCTENDCSGCIERTGRACHWVEPELCSACVDPSTRYTIGQYIADQAARRQATQKGGQ